MSQMNGSSSPSLFSPITAMHRHTKWRALGLTDERWCGNAFHYYCRMLSTLELSLYAWHIVDAHLRGKYFNFMNTKWLYTKAKVGMPPINLIRWRSWVLRERMKGSKRKPSGVFELSVWWWLDGSEVPVPFDCHPLAVGGSGFVVWD